MDAQARSWPWCLAGHRDVDRAVVRADAPNRSGRVVAQDAAGCEHRCHLMTVRGRERSDLEDAAIHTHEPPVRDPVRDRARPETHRRQLCARDDPVLAGGQCHHGRITRVHFVHFASLSIATWTLCSSGVHFAHLA